MVFHLLPRPGMMLPIVWSYWLLEANFPPLRSHTQVSKVSCQLICLFRSGGIADIKRKPWAARRRGKGGQNEEKKKSTDWEGGMSLQAPGTVNGWVRGCRRRRWGREREGEKGEKNLIQIIFTPWALKCKSQIKEVWNGNEQDWKRISSSRGYICMFRMWDRHAGPR